MDFVLVMGFYFAVCVMWGALLLGVVLPLLTALARLIQKLIKSAE